MGDMKSNRKKFRRRIRLINFFGELIASSIFSLLYFIFISRYLDDSYGLDLISLGFLIGGAYFAAVYIPFHTYRIHVIPFISIIRALQKRKLQIVLYKIPAQFFGALIGVSIFYKLSALVGKTVDISEMWSFKIVNVSDLMFFNILTVFVLCYLFYVIQLLFKNMGFMSTFFYALVIQVVFIFTGHVAEISSLNVFGYFSVYLLEGNPGFSQGALLNFIIHFLLPSLVAYLIYFYIRDRYVEKQNVNRTKQVAS